MCACCVFALRFFFYFLKSVFLAELLTYGHSMLLFFTFQFYELNTSFHAPDIPEHPAKRILKKARCVCVRALPLRSIPALLCVIFAFLLLAVSGTVCRVIEGSAYTCTRLCYTRKSAVLKHRKKPESRLSHFFFPACRGHLNAQTHTHAVKMKHSLRD